MVRAVSSAGEHYLDMVGAIGSIPIPPTIFIQNSHLELRASDPALAVDFGSMKALGRELTAHGLRISVVKHAHHAIDIDVPGEDGYRVVKPVRMKRLLRPRGDER